MAKKFEISGDAGQLKKELDSIIERIERINGTSINIDTDTFSKSKTYREQKYQEVTSTYQQLSGQRYEQVRNDRKDATKNLDKELESKYGESGKKIEDQYNQRAEEIYGNKNIRGAARRSAFEKAERTRISSYDEMDDERAAGISSINKKYMPLERELAPQETNKRLKELNESVQASTKQEEVGTRIEREKAEAEKETGYIGKQRRRIADLEEKRLRAQTKEESLMYEKQIAETKKDFGEGSASNRESSLRTEMGAIVSILGLQRAFGAVSHYANASQYNTGGIGDKLGLQGLDPGSIMGDIGTGMLTGGYGGAKIGGAQGAVIGGLVGGISAAIISIVGKTELREQEAANERGMASSRLAGMTGINPSNLYDLNFGGYDKLKFEGLGMSGTQAISAATQLGQTSGIANPKDLFSRLQTNTEFEKGFGLSEGTMTSMSSLERLSGDNRKTADIMGELLDVLANQGISIKAGENDFGALNERMLLLVQLNKEQTNVMKGGRYNSSTSTGIIGGLEKADASLGYNLFSGPTAGTNYQIMQQGISTMRGGGDTMLKLRAAAMAYPQHAGNKAMLERIVSRGPNDEAYTRVLQSLIGQSTGGDERLLMAKENEMYGIQGAARGIGNVFMKYKPISADVRGGISTTASRRAIQNVFDTEQQKAEISDKFAVDGKSKVLEGFDKSKYFSEYENHVNKMNGGMSQLGITIEELKTAIIVTTDTLIENQKQLQSFQLNPNLQKFLNENETHGEK